MVCWTFYTAEGCVSKNYYILKYYFISILSDLPSHIWSEFSIYGDLDNERTEIDSELAFGFLKMGGPPID